MLKGRQELEKFLSKKCEKIVFNSKRCEEIRNYMYEKYNVPTGVTMDMIARNVIGDKTEFVLFCLLDGIDHTEETNYKKDFFTGIEINQYVTEKLETNRIKFPLKIKCEQVTPDQWIGATNTKFLMELRRAQLIKYNANAQRVMKRIIKGENVLFKLIPNKLAIKSIRVLLNKDMYIPTTITLNIPYDSDAKFYYNEQTRELVIEELETFDISDGFHRYLSLCEESDANKEFNYPMEIRIINFTDEKARQFIYQEDQKTKMAKDQSNAMNSNRPSNTVIDKLNEMSTFEFKGQIGINKGNINYTTLSDLIEYFYFQKRKEYTNIDIRNARDDVKTKLNALVEYDSMYLEKVFKEKELALIFYVFDQESDLNKACQIIDNILKSHQLDSIKAHKVKKTLFNCIENLLK